ncbi:ferritin [Proteocatella sphenisci]|uniref:ferritin n=1 Tax=Proteocatella sphenisci TaxID=181070 RepID=UPI00048D2058|nr:ferritin [Proteocatella sphenisci]
MLNEKVSKLLNEQINHELYSAYLYLDISNYYKHNGLDGFANWYKIQAQEERDHAMLFMEYLQNNGDIVTLEAIAKPDKVYEGFKMPIEVAFEHEVFVTNLVHNIYGQAAKVKDYRTIQFLDWFVKEQGEEEATADGLVKKMELFGADSRGLYLIDTELAARVYSPPSLVL